MPKAIIIDGNSLIYRIYYASQRNNTDQIAFKDFYKTIYSLDRSIQKIISVMEEDVKYAVVAFDTSRETFRKIKFSEYKSNRKSMPSPLYHNLPKLRKLFQDKGFVIVDAPDSYEGDDVIATISSIFSDSHIETGIFSTDRDLLQLVNDYVSVYLFRKKEWIKHDIDNFEELNDGMSPCQIADLKALAGDPSDNYKGLPGIGPMTSIKWLREFGIISNLYLHLDELSDKHQKILIENKEHLRLCSELACLVKDLDLSRDLKNYERLEINKADNEVNSGAGESGRDI